MHYPAVVKAPPAHREAPVFPPDARQCAQRYGWGTRHMQLGQQFNNRRNMRGLAAGRGPPKQPIEQTKLMALATSYPGAPTKNRAPKEIGWL